MIYERETEEIFEQESLGNEKVTVTIRIRIFGATLLRIRLVNRRVQM